MHTATMKLIIYITSLLTFLQHPAFAASDSCPVTQYSGSFKAKKHEENKAIVGCSYKNVTINFIQECFSRCLSDCECLSYQISGTRCELLDEDKFTFPSRFNSVFGYKYYQLKQHFKASSIGGTFFSEDYWFFYLHIFIASYVESTVLFHVNIGQQSIVLFLFTFLNTENKFVITIIWTLPLPRLIPQVVVFAHL
jgi:hypothetical protein